MLSGVALCGMTPYEQISASTSVAAIVVAVASTVVAWSAVRASRDSVALVLLKRRFEVYTAVSRLHAVLFGWDTKRTTIEGISPRIDAAFLDFGIAVAHAEVLFPKGSPILPLITQMGDDASQIAIDRKDPDTIRLWLSMGTDKEKVGFAQGRGDLANRFFLHSLPQLKKELMPYVDYEKF